jgi:hypothetical protein
MCPDKDSFGPLKWRPLSSYRQRDWAGMLAGQMQAEEQDLALQRKVWLETLRLSDEQLLLVLVLMLQGAARHLSRKQAVRLLTAPVITQLLDLSVPYQQVSHRLWRVLRAPTGRTRSMQGFVAICGCRGLVSKARMSAPGACAAGHSHASRFTGLGTTARPPSHLSCFIVQPHPMLVIC